MKGFLMGRIVLGFNAWRLLSYGVWPGGNCKFEMSGACLLQAEDKYHMCFVDCCITSCCFLLVLSKSVHLLLCILSCFVVLVSGGVFLTLLCVTKD
jgi:hypothetical protein